MKEFLRIFRFVWPYRFRILVAIGCLGLGAVLNAVTIGSVQPIFDGLFAAEGRLYTLSVPPAVRSVLGPHLDRLQAFLQAHRISALTFVGLGLLAVFVLKSVFTYLQQILVREVSERVMMDLRNALYGHLHRLSVAFFTRTPTGEMMSRVTYDVDQVGSSLTDLFKSGLREPFHIVGFIALLLLIKWQLALVSLVVLPVAILPIVKFGAKIRARGRRVQERRAELNTVLQEAISGIRVVKAFGMEEYERGRFAAKNLEVYRAVMRIVRVDALSSPVLEILGATGIVLGVWLGGYLVFTHALSPGGLMAFLGALASLYQPVRRLGQINNNVQKGMGAIRRVLEFLDTAPDVAEAPDAVVLPPIREGIAFHQVSFAYEPERPVLSGVSFTAKLGEIVAIVGSSGAGKTTLVNLIPRFYDPTDGGVEIDRMDLRRVTLRSLRDQLGIVTQETVLFDDSVMNNIAYGRRDVPRERVVEAARVANADEFVRELAEGYDTRIGERGVRLSGGQKQRIAIARAILKDPPILILDEATSALDAESERQVQEALDRLMANRTTFVIAHRLSTIMRADKIVVLEGGRVVEVGTHAELLAREEVYHRLYRAQFQPD